MIDFFERFTFGWQKANDCQQSSSNCDEKEAKKKEQSLRAAKQCWSKKNAILLLQLGCQLSGWCAEMVRQIFLPTSKLHGEPSERNEQCEGFFFGFVRL